MAEEQTQDVDQQADEGVEVNEAELAEATDQPSGEGAGQIDIFLDVQISVQAQLGQANVSMRDLLQLAPGSVLKLDKQVGESVDLFMRGARFATGKLVVVGEQLGVQIEEILSQSAAAASDNASAAEEA